MAQVKAVPDGYTTVTPFFNIVGAAEAIELYKKAFGAEERMRFSGPDGKIAIAELKIGNAIIRLSDAVKDPVTRSTTQLYVEDVDAWWKRAVDAGLEIAWPLQDMFFGDRFGVLSDRFGNRWPLASRREDLSLDEIRQRGAAAMGIKPG